MATDTRPPEERGHHDWHSADYVRQWVAQYELRVDGRRPQFDLLADLIPFPREQAIRVLDVGAGWGPVTRHLLERFPHARSTLLDYSEHMFAEARSRLRALGSRVQYVAGNLSQPGAVQAAVRAAGGPFDAIVSSLCIHNLRPTERVQALYGELRAATAPGGCFLNLDYAGTPSPLLYEVLHRARVEQVRRRRLEETGALPSYEEVDVDLRAQRQAWAGGQPATVSAAAAQAATLAATRGPIGRTSGGFVRSLFDHLTWLQEAGYDAVECFWRDGRQALIGAYVEPATKWSAEVLPGHWA